MYGPFSVPPLPFGCTTYAQTDLCINEDKTLLDPMRLENVTHSSERGGIDIRESLGAAVQVFNRAAYFNVHDGPLLDAFDAVRVALYITKDERRSVSIGTPWFPQWSNAGFGTESVKNTDGTFTLRAAGAPTTIMPAVDIPLYYTGILGRFFALRLSWHNWVICGWKEINGVPYLIGKPWLGASWADGGFCYFSREVFNSVMTVTGTAAFTLAKKPATSVQTINNTPVSVATPQVNVTQSAPTQLSRSDILYNTAYKMIGRDASPADAAPDEVGCVDSVNQVFKAAFGAPLMTPETLSTARLYEKLKTDPRFVQLKSYLDAKAGDIIVCPTGLGTNPKMPHGHTGIMGKKWIMSNDSATGIWDANYTLESWTTYFCIKGGYPAYAFRLK